MVLHRSLVLLCIFAAPDLVLGKWNPGLRRTFGMGGESFTNLPQNKSNAISLGWGAQWALPDATPGKQYLELYCDPADPTIGTMYDDNGHLAGLQVAVSKENFTAKYDMHGLGFKDWSITVNGKSAEFWANHLLFLSPESLAKDKDTRLAQRAKLNDKSGNPTTILIEDLYLVGIDGQLLHITEEDLAASTTEYKEQACVPLMGKHYFLNMTKGLECNKKSMYPWFLLWDHSQIIGAGMVVMGSLKEPNNNYETPPELAVKMIIPNAPQCVYDLTKNFGTLTMHLYFIENPRLVLCSTVFDFMLNWLGIL